MAPPTPNPGRRERPRGHRNGSNRPRHRDPEIDARVQQLDADEPLSLPEQIVGEAGRGGRVGVPSADDPSPPDNLADLQRMSIDTLHDLADEESIEDFETLSRQDLIFRILKKRMTRNGLMYGEGTLEVLPDGFGFLRSPQQHFQSCPDDIYVSPSQIRRFALRTGVHVAGQIRPPKENERYFALLRVESVDNARPSKRRRVPFAEMTPLHPVDRLRLEAAPEDLTGRLVDLLAPVGFGGRGLIIAPPRGGTSTLIRSIVGGLNRNHPDAVAAVLLVDERPEEVAELEGDLRGPACEVISSTFDEPASRHVQVAHLVIERAKRQVESGRHVVVIIDSLTRLAHAHDAVAEEAASTSAAGLSREAVGQCKEWLSAARRTDRGSLTILAVVDVETGDDSDEAVAAELRSASNLQIVLDSGLVRRRIYPAVHPFDSVTRREESLWDEDEARHVPDMRDRIADLSDVDAARTLIRGLRDNDTNADYLRSLAGHA